MNKVYLFIPASMAELKEEKQSISAFVNRLNAMFSESTYIHYEYINNVEINEVMQKYKSEIEKCDLVFFMFDKQFLSCKF